VTHLGTAPFCVFPLGITFPHSHAPAPQIPPPRSFSLVLMGRVGQCSLHNFLYITVLWKEQCVQKQINQFRSKQQGCCSCSCCYGLRFGMHTSYLSRCKGEDSFVAEPQASMQCNLGGSCSSRVFARFFGMHAGFLARWKEDSMAAKPQALLQQLCEKNEWF